MRRLVVNGLAAAVIVGTPIVGHTMWSTMTSGDAPTAYASTDLGDDLLGAMDARQVTPRATPSPAPTRPAASPTVSGAGAQTGKGGAGAPAQAPKGGAGAPVQAPKGAGAAPAQAPTGGAAPAALPRTGELPVVGGLTLAATVLVGAGFALRRFRR